MPEVYLLGIHKVTSYDAWYEVFSSEERVESRKKAGCLGGMLYKERKDGETMAVALLEWDNRENLESFLKGVDAPQFQEVLRKATVQGKPQTHILDFMIVTPY